MFAAAIKKSQQYSYPVVVSLRRADGSTDSLIGTHFILNEDGWFLTAFHIVNMIKSIREEVHSYNIKSQQGHQVENDKDLKMVQKKKQSRSTKKHANDSVTNFSVWWGRDNWRVKFFVVDEFSDLAIGKIEDFDRNSVANYPQFKNPNINFEVGENLIKLGFAFHNFVPEFDEKNNIFRFPPNAIPMPFFPIDGIFTRSIIMKNQVETAKFVETSSPGLRGQSGGPTFDRKGRIWAMQSRTNHYELGFSPKAHHQRETEHQFLNCGIGTHVETIINFLRKHNLKFVMSEE